MSKTVGQILKDTRTLKELSLQEAARATHIKLQYLQELENDRPELLPSRAQARGFLRLYAAFLGIDAQPLLELLEKPASEEKEIEIPSESALREVSAGEEEKSVKPPKKSGRVMDKLHALFGRLPKLNKKEKATEETSAMPEGSETAQELQTQKPAQESTRKGKTHKEKTGQKEKGKTAPKENAPLRSSANIFKEVGQQMRQRREKLGLSLSDVEQFTRLRRMYVQAIEDGNFEDLPSSVQGRGMVSNYAHFLEMDQDAVLTLYAEGLEAQRKEKMQEKWTTHEPAVRVSIHLPEKLRRILSPDLLFGSLVVIALFVFIFWGASRIFGQDSKATPTGAPSISEMLQSTLTPTLEMQETAGTLTVQSEQVTATSAATQPAALPATPVATANAAPLQLYIVAQQRAWMRVTVDGEVEFEGRIVPGNAYTFSGEGNIQLITGNGAALEVYFNQKYLGLLGDFGEVVNLDFSAEGLSRPTPTITPTLLPTSTPTLTPTATPKPSAAPTVEK
jgi:cytoskeleton protein RodZ